jgi:hypothetical protein
VCVGSEIADAMRARKGSRMEQDARGAGKRHEVVAKWAERDVGGRAMVNP